MKNLLIETLSKVGFIAGETLFLQGTFNPAEKYPDTFATFWTNNTAAGVHFDNDTKSYNWAFTVILYSNNPAIVNEKPNEIRAALKAAGFIPQGKGQDVPSDEPTHTGWAMDFLKTEYL